METKNLTNVNFVSCLNFDTQLDKGEIVDRVIKNYLCSISRGKDREITEKTYEIINGNLRYLTNNIIPIGHPRHKELNNKLLQAKL